MITRTLLVSSVIAVAGLGLIGVGSNAVFTQDTISSQQITAGTMKVVIFEAPATDGGATLTLAAVGPTNSTFTSGDHKVIIKNTGNIAVQEITSTPGFTTGSSSASAALAAQVYLCEVSSGTVIYNGPLSSATAQAIQGTLAVNAMDDYTVNYYAGTVPTACGAVTAVGAVAVPGNSVAPSLLNTAQGGVITPTLTVSYTG
jgi:predicted ribosomally synthesized peptide with SipW-like signal peptide